ncbi:hypothetical protein GCM10009613_22220 [Pseudonocardia kongjuensis]|uniref:Uncharacterized protein n=1 Tax=Pseudonocardia kongjuensis TaxID=102227 RepID=A0ABP4IC84_9PSEU
MHLHLHGAGVTMDAPPHTNRRRAVSVPPAGARQVPSPTLPVEPSVPAPEQNVAVTCARDGYSHVVPHAVLADSLASGTGHCTAMCGHVVLPASLAAPPGDSCLLCAETTGIGRRAPRRRSWASLARSARTP